MGLYAKDDEKLTKTSSFCVKICHLGVVEVLWEGETGGRKAGEQQTNCVALRADLKSEESWETQTLTGPRSGPDTWLPEAAVGPHMCTPKGANHSQSQHHFLSPKARRLACSSYVCNRQVCLACFTVLYSNPDSRSPRKDFQSSISSTAIFGGRGEKSSLGCKTHLPSRSQSPYSLVSNCGVTKAVLEVNQQARSPLYKASDLCKYDLVCKVYTICAPQSRTVELL